MHDAACAVVEGFDDAVGFNPITVADVLREDVPSVEIDPDELLKDMRTYERYVRGPRLS